jgi:hypothetical protein
LYTGSTNVGTQLTTIGGNVTDVEAKVAGNTASLANNVNSIYSSLGGSGYCNTWAISTGGTIGVTQGMATNGTTVVHGGGASVQYSSDNGVTFVDVAVSLPNAGVLWVSQLNLYIAKNSTQCQTSTDGITWTAAVAVSGGTPGGGNTSQGCYVYAFGLVVTSNGTAGSYIQTSPDGLTWTVQTATRNPFSMVFTGTKIITFGQSGCMTSTDGITWVNDAQTVVARASCFSSSTATIYTIPSNTTSLMKSTDNGVSWTTLTSIFPIAVSPQFLIWNDTARVGYVFQGGGSAATPMYMYQFNGTDYAVGGNLLKQGLTTVGGGPYSGLYIPSMERFIIKPGGSSRPCYSTKNGSIVSAGNIMCYGALSGGGVKVMAYGFNQTTTADAYGVPSGRYGAASGGVSGQSTRFYAPVVGIITAYSKVFLTANTTAILNIYVSGVLQYSSVAGDLSTTTGSVSGLNVAVAAGAYIEVLISGATIAGLGNGLIVIVY